MPKVKCVGFNGQMCDRDAHARHMCKKHYAQWDEINNPSVKARRKAFYNKNKEKLLNANKAWHQSISGRFKKAARTAAFRNLSWELSIQEYVALLSQDCYYSNEPLSPSGVGLDRIDNTKGYTIDNVVPCCESCNISKMDIWTTEEFKIMIDAVMAYRAAKALKEVA